MEALKAEEFLNELISCREAFWEKMNAERKSYGAEKPLSPATVLRRLQFGVVMERISSVCASLVLVRHNQARQEHLPAVCGLDRVGWGCDRGCDHLWMIDLGPYRHRNTHL